MTINLLGTLTKKCKYKTHAPNLKTNKLRYMLCNIPVKVCITVVKRSNMCLFGYNWTKDRTKHEVCCSALQVFASANRFGEGSGRIYLDSLQCTGHEKHVDSCSSSGLLNTNCRHSSDVGVVCLS